MNNQNYYRVSIKGIIIDEQGRVLLAREKDGSWEMLGGGLDHDEDPMACLRREVNEETGLEVTYVSPNPIYFLTAKRRNAENYIANVVYEIQLKDLEFTPSDECQELRFFSVDEMEKIQLFPNVEELRKQIKNKKQ